MPVWGPVFLPQVVEVIEMMIGYRVSYQMKSTDYSINGRLATYWYALLYVSYLSQMIDYS